MLISEKDMLHVTITESYIFVVAYHIVLVQVYLIVLSSWDQWMTTHLHGEN